MMNSEFVQIVLWFWSLFHHSLRN